MQRIIKRDTYLKRSHSYTKMEREETHDEELSVFEPASTDTSLQSREWMEFRPVNQTTEGPLWNSNIAAQPTTYIDLKRSLLNVKLRITNADNSPIEDSLIVALVNLPLHTLFSQIDVSFQQTPFGHTGEELRLQSVHRDDSEKRNESIQKTSLTGQLFFKRHGGPR